MGFRQLERKMRDRSGSIIGGPGWQVAVWNDQQMTAASALKLDSAGAFVRDNPGYAHSGWQYLLTALLHPGDATVQLESTAGIVKGDVFQVVDGLFVAPALVVKSVDSGVQITLVSTPGGAHNYAIGSTAGDPDDYGDWAAWVDDAADVWVTVTKVGSSIPSVPKQLHIKQTATTMEIQEEGVAVSTRGKINVQGVGLKVTDDAGNARTNVSYWRHDLWVAGIL